MTHLELPLGQQKALAIAPKVTGVMSIIGSSLIILDVYRGRKKKKYTYSRLVLLMSCFDIAASFAFFLSTWALPAYTRKWGASGNVGSCSFQGFLIQLGIAVPCYNCCLTLHYFLIIVCKWSQSQIERAEKWMHGCVLTWAIGTAIAGLPLTIYNQANLWCWISSLPEACANAGYIRNTGVPCIRGDNSWIYRWAFYYGPFWLIIVIVIVTMGSVCYVTWKGERASRKYRHHQPHPTSTRSSDRKNADKIQSLTRQVAVQALSYVLAFLLSASFASAVRITQTSGKEPSFGIYLMMAITLPSQGIFSAIVYVRPRFQRYRSKHPNDPFWKIIAMSLKFTLWKRTQPVSNLDRTPSAESDGVGESTVAPKRTTTNEVESSEFEDVDMNVSSDNVSLDEEEDIEDVLDLGYILQKKRHQSMRRSAPRESTRVSVALEEIPETESL